MIQPMNISHSIAGSPKSPKPPDPTNVLLGFVCILSCALMLLTSRPGKIWIEDFKGSFHRVDMN